MVGYVDFDSVTHLGHISVDVKTAQSAESEKFSRDITTGLYYLQSAIYRRGYMKTAFQFPKMKWVVMESNEPYCCNVLDYSDKDIQQAQAEFTGLLTMFVKCMEEKRWNEGYMFWRDNQPYPYFLPKWNKSPIAVWNNDED